MPELAIIIPVLNERDNIPLVADRIRSVLTDVSWEVVFVDDDSPDGTGEVCRSCAKDDTRVRVIQRIGRRGLASACVEGMMSTASPWIAVMDGDLQHDESVLPAMLSLAKEKQLDVVIASRNTEGGSMGEFSARRVWLSHAGRRLSALLSNAADVTDPMSGFFLVSRRFLLEVVHDLSTCGFKILLDMLASSRRPVRIAEVPFTFRNRQRGSSKLDSSTALDYLLLLSDKLLGDLVPVRFALYLCVGVTGVLVHLAALGLLRTALPGTDLATHQAFATVVAILSNFFLNNEITFRDRKLRGSRSLCRGVFWYFTACSIGALANVATAQFLTDAGIGWFIAGGIGSIISAVWNFGAASLLAWKIGMRRRSSRRMPIESHAMATAGHPENS